MSMPDFEVPVGTEARNPFARRIAVIIAIATLLAAIVGFLQNQASSENGAASLRAQQYAIEATQALVLAQERARVAVDTWSISLEQRVRAANVGQQITYAPEAEVARLKATQAYWLTLAQRTEELSGIDRASPDGPDQDPAFPARLLASGTRDAIRLEALQDAANELGEGWSGQATTYTAILAVLAVALYLLGFSLTIDVRPAKLLFAGVGVLLVVLAGGWTGGQLALAPVAASDGAADAYADGAVALKTAYDQPGYQAVVDAMTRAIELRPTFARAYLGRATAEFMAGSPQTGGFVSIATDEALRASTSDLEKAAALGLDDTTLLSELGFQRYLQGIRGDRAMLEESITLTGRALARAADNPVMHFNLAVALLAADRPGDARTAYEQGVLRTLYLDLPGGVLREDSWSEMAYVGGALTDLELLASARPDLAGAVADTRAYLVGAVARGTGAVETTGGSAAVGRLAADVFPSLVQWRGDLTGFDEATDHLSVIWSRKDPEGNDWAVMPEVSSLVVSPSVNTSPDNGANFGLARYIGSTVPARCLPDGTYRVELFVNGRAIGTAEATADAGAYAAFAARDIGAAFCRPADWLSDPGSELGLTAGFVSPDGTKGAAVAHVQVPQLPVSDDELMATVMDAAVAGLAEQLGSTPVYNETEGTTSLYFMGLETSRWRWYDYEGGYVRIGAGLDSQGGLYLGVLYGPLDWFDGSEWQRIVESFETFQ